jgi:hypothetical protein
MLKAKKRQEAASHTTNIFLRILASTLSASRDISQDAVLTDAGALLVIVPAVDGGGCCGVAFFLF